MPMNNRIMVPRSTFDSDALAYINAVQAADGQALEGGVKAAINKFVRTAKADGWWGDLGAASFLAGPRTIAGGLVPLRGGTITNNNFVSGDINRELGWLGNGVNKYLQTSYAGNTPPQDDISCGVWASTAATSGSYIGNVITTGGVVIGVDATNIYMRCQNASFDTFAVAVPTGLVGMSRTSGTEYNRRISGATAAQARASESPSATTFQVFARSAGALSNGRVTFWWAGAALSLSAIDTALTTYMADIAAAIA